VKVKIGPYKNFFGPYQIAEKILFWKNKYEDDSVHKLGRWLSGDHEKDPNQWLGKNLKPSLLLRFCQWIESKRKRTVKIHLDNYDTWNMNSTLSLIVVPMLKQLKGTKHGAPWTDDEDVPEHLRSSVAAPKKNEWDTDENHFLRWEWVMNEMIWAFEQDNNEWENNYYSGEIDMRSEKVEGSTYTRLVDGPSHTFKIDSDGMKKHQERINNGRRLFAKYYDGLWD
jgi:hypothetical protein